jgi:hypothetical protein
MHPAPLFLCDAGRGVGAAGAPEAAMDGAEGRDGAGPGFDASDMPRAPPLAGQQCLRRTCSCSGRRGPCGAGWPSGTATSWGGRWRSSRCPATRRRRTSRCAARSARGPCTGSTRPPSTPRCTAACSPRPGPGLPVKIPPGLHCSCTLCCGAIFRNILPYIFYSRTSIFLGL